MMINRMRGFYEEPEQRQPEDDYFVVAYVFEDFYVTREVAERIVRELDAPTPPRWIRFTDVHGSYVTVRSQRIDHVREWTAGQRQSARAFRRAREQEEKTDRRPWEDDD
jgi:hypothetical protein